ncbi:alpha/beta fold hydrolase [Amycolatopsis magusensis]|uniref:Pimeloyl-ACP methyl ester carboxylesterase n=1 Tax=Amycolatopsis magusensis TaxID=882444 RepID=A0ABS4PSX5_9PSEU|nr:alpha/beta fold hydrolase [Amycolatopsis magusensis]MBP2182526.1 pimeloyl-ACP methyl ester carboxylesterase [Amycolatopsis magusensis]
MSDTTLAVRRFTPEAVSGPPVLLLHGFASDGHTDWITTGWPSVLTAAGRAVLVPDLPGHGSSPAPADAPTAKSITAELARLVDDLPEVDVVGYSLGARLAWELPVQAPVRRLVLAGLSPVEPFGAVDLDAALAFAGGGKPPSDPLTAMIARMITAPGRNPGALARCVEGLRQEPFAPAPGVISVPTRFVAGTEDPVSQGIDQLTALVPGSDLIRVPGDHGGALRSPEFKTTTLDFLR